MRGRDDIKDTVASWEAVPDAFAMEFIEMVGEDDNVETAGFGDESTEVAIEVASTARTD